MEQEHREIYNKNKVLSLIVHDLRNPLTAIKIISDLLANEFDKYSSESIKEFIELIQDASDVAHEILEGLMVWIGQDGNLFLSPIPFDVNIIISKKLNLLIADAQRKNIQFISNVPKDTFVYADPKTVKIILRNLISNAIKFTPSGGEIRITSLDIGNFIEITVSDTGIGIEPEILEKLFTTDIRKYGTNGETGTGVGLILSKELVKKNNGKIWAESEVGKGSQFKFTLPKYQEDLKV